ncbi:MAG: tRNA 2-thiouridine(34) synthase MnmA [Kiritimatiellia bacterium]
MTVAVGMSGGVDSTVTAWLLARQGHEVIGLTMQIWDGSVSLPDEGRSGCYGPGEARDLAFARDTAQRLGIRHITVPLADAYNRCVLDPFRAAYRAGRTPNPCVVCNQRMKFGLLLDEARRQGIAFDRFATGHYARTEFDAAHHVQRLLRGVDAAKDQSYFLARLTQEQLCQVWFPLGGMVKAEVIRLAHEAGFSDVAAREESQDFIESESYAPLFDASDNRPGPIVDTAGRELGRHRGIVHYTVGQRQGMGIATGGRLYVQALRPETNTVVMGTREEVFRPGCQVEDVSWIRGTPPPAATTCRVLLRYHHPGVQARLEPRTDGAWQVDFAEPQFAVAPGQAAVFYDHDEVLGGGWILPTAGAA